MPDTSKYCGAIALHTPVVPAAKPGQLSLATESPG